MEENHTIHGTISGSARKLSGNIKEKLIGLSGSVKLRDEYTGPYSVIPSIDSQTISTQYKYLTNDIFIYPIPYSAEVNETGGLTVKIG